MYNSVDSIFIASIQLVSFYPTIDFVVFLDDEETYY